MALHFQSERSKQPQIMVHQQCRMFSMICILSFGNWGLLEPWKNSSEAATDLFAYYSHWQLWYLPLKLKLHLFNVCISLYLLNAITPTSHFPLHMYKLLRLHEEWSRDDTHELPDFWVQCLSLQNCRPTNEDKSTINSNLTFHLQPSTTAVF